MWILLTVDAFRSRLTSAELTALRTVQVDTHQPDPADEALRRSVEEARGYLGARPGGKLGPMRTVPPQLEGPVMDLARYRLCTRLAVGRVGSTLLPEAREQEYKDALRLLRDVAAGKYSVEDPEDVSETLGNDASSPRITPRPEARLP